MKKSIYEELLHHAIDTLENIGVANYVSDDFHHEAFNADYYVIGYYQASLWLSRHELDAFEAISEVVDQQENHFGEVTLKATDINSESIVNQLVYFYGLELLQDFNLDQDYDDVLAELKEAM